MTIKSLRKSDLGNIKQFMMIMESQLKYESKISFGESKLKCLVPLSTVFPQEFLTP